MNDPRLSMATRKLLAAAKVDGPTAAARAQMWSSVSGAVGTAGAVSTANIVLNGGSGATKLLTIGGLFGGTLVVGIASVLLKIGAAPAPNPHSASQGIAQAVRVAVTEPPTMAAFSPGPMSVPPNGVATPHSVGLRILPRGAAPPAREDALAREASLVAEARGALARGDPGAALHAIRAARVLPSRQLMPEELAVEEQALRALGQSDQANGIEVQLRLQYPESALAR